MEIEFVVTKGGMHGGMEFSPSVAVFKHSPTRGHDRRFEWWFTRPTEAEARTELDKRSPGWKLVAMH